jgi:hypothetical protein
VSVLDETNRSIGAAIADGTLDEDISAGPIAAIRRVAEQLDDPDFPVIDGRLDNVSLPTYLRYCAEMHLTPASRPEKKPEGAGGTIAHLQAVQRKRKRSA